MIKVNKLTDYSILILNHFAKESADKMFNASQLADALNLPAPTVSKILKILVKNQLVISHRGAMGGYQLAKPLKSISIVEIIEAMEGRISVTQCGAGTGLCTHERSCSMRDPWQRINQMVVNLLSQVSIADMQPNKELL